MWICSLCHTDETNELKLDETRVSLDQEVVSKENDDQSVNVEHPIQITTADFNSQPDKSDKVLTTDEDTKQETDEDNAEQVADAAEPAFIEANNKKSLSDEPVYAADEAQTLKSAELKTETGTGSEENPASSGKGKISRVWSKKELKNVVYDETATSRQRENTGMVLKVNEVESPHGYVYLSLNEKDMELTQKYSTEWPVNEDYEKIIICAKPGASFKKWKLQGARKVLCSKVNSIPGQLFCEICAFVKDCMKTYKGEIWLKDIFVAPDFQISIAFHKTDNTIEVLREPGIPLNIEDFKPDCVAAYSATKSDPFVATKMTKLVFSGAHEPKKHCWVSEVL